MLLICCVMLLGIDTVPRSKLWASVLHEHLSWHGLRCLWAVPYLAHARPWCLLYWHRPWGCVCIYKIICPFTEYPRKQNNRLSAWRKILNYKDAITHYKDAQRIYVPAKFLIFWNRNFESRFYLFMDFNNVPPSPLLRTVRLLRDSVLILVWPLCSSHLLSPSLHFFWVRWKLKAR